VADKRAHKRRGLLAALPRVPIRSDKLRRFLHVAQNEVAPDGHVSKVYLVLLVTDMAAACSTAVERRDLPTRLIT
jgi:hypothetical protein